MAAQRGTFHVSSNAHSVSGPRFATWSQPTSAATAVTRSSDDVFSFQHLAISFSWNFRSRRSFLARRGFMALSRKIRNVLLFVLVAAFANHAQAMATSGMAEPDVSVTSNYLAHAHFDKEHFHQGVDLHEAQHELLSHSDEVSHSYEDGDCHHGCCKSAACCHFLPLAQPAPVLWSHTKTLLAMDGTSSLRPSPKPEGRPPKSI